jgi:hypothetical protein
MTEDGRAGIKENALNYGRQNKAKTLQKSFKIPGIISEVL